MPSFFKKIKQKFFSAADNQSPTQSTGDTSLNQTSAKKKPTETIARDNPHLDAARARKINATIIPQSSHQINFRNIDNNAIKIVKDLQRASYESYLVGGCVRDLLLNKRPKDFDVTTGAHPEQAHKVFSRSRLIGRRFKLLHVRFGRELIEVATFRASHDQVSSDTQAKQADSGMILRDNVYGTIDQDAMRRDFTINALYYDVNTRSIYDFTNGYQDIADRQIKMIGEPNERYREDPVRMLRAIRFAAKLDFEIEQRTAEPIKSLAPMLYDIAPARLFDEVLKLLQSGHGLESLKLQREYQLLETILPQTSQALNDNLENAEQLIFNALQNTDRRIKQRKSVSPGFLFATLLWPSVQAQLKATLANKRMPPLTALHEASSKVIGDQVKRTSIPKRFSTNIREIWELQLRLTHKPEAKAEQFLEHPRFRAAYDLLVLREKSGEDLNGISQWWTDYQSADQEQREQLVNALKAKGNKPSKKKKKPEKPATKPAFEKFDVVEQIKAKPSAAKKKRSEAKPTPVDSTAAKEVTESKKTAAQPATTKVEVTEKELTSTSTTPDVINAVKETVQESATVSQPVLHTPVSAPAPAPEREETDAKTKAPSTPTPRRKARRSRVKNDPRNK